MLSIYGIDFLDINNKVLFIIAVMISSLFADIDHERSFLGRKLGLIAKIINFIFGHRGFIHSLLFALILYFIVRSYLNIELVYGIVLGFAGHLILDSLTVEGIRPFYPLKLRVKGFIRTSGLAEKLIKLCIFVLIIYKLL